MDSNLLSTFLEVANTRHFGHAAENLYITQSTVSARIQHLEEQLNTRLFERNTKQVALTPEGEKFLKHAESILLAWTNAKLDLANESTSNQSIRIASSHDLWHYLFRDQLTAIILEQALFVHAVSCSAADLHLKLFNNEADMVLAYEPVKQSGWKSTVLGNLELALLSRVKNQPQSRSRNYEFAQQEAYIHIDWGDDFQMFASKKLPKTISHILQSDNAVLAEELIDKLNACAYLPRQLVKLEQATLSDESKKAAIFKRKIYACYAEASEQRKIAESLLPYFKLKK